MKSVIAPAEAGTSIGPFSPGVRVGSWIYLSGQGGFLPETGTIISNDVAEQTEQAFKNVGTLLNSEGASLDDIVTVLVHLVDLDEFIEFNQAYAQILTGPKPARTTVRADLVAGMRVELTVVAQISEQPT